MDQLSTSFYILCIGTDGSVQVAGPLSETTCHQFCNWLVSFPTVATLALWNGYCSTPGNMQVMKGIVNGNKPKSTMGQSIHQHLGLATYEDWKEWVRKEGEAYGAGGQVGEGADPIG